MTVVAVIPARGGSKGLVDKNLRVVGGRTLVARAVVAAHGAQTVDQVVVSTDSERIASEARRAGATVVERPPELATDEASSESALLHALEQSPEAEVVAFVQCTSPFTRSADIDRTVAPVKAGRADVALTVMDFHGFVWRADDEQGLTGVNHDRKRRERRQDRINEYLETGAVYALRPDGLRQSGSRFFGRVEPIVVDPRRSLEIDTVSDLEQARDLAAALDGAPQPLELPVPSLVVLDFDGVFTDNQVLVDQDGKEAVWCHRGDGHGLAQLAELVPIVVLSTERNPVVAARCEKLGLPYRQGLGAHKVDALRSLAEDSGVALENVLFVGNDVNDLGCLQAAGTAVAVADAVPQVRTAAHAVLSRRGGDGALRELADALLPSLQEAEGRP